MNYSINEDLLNLDCFKGLKRGHKTSALVVLSFILHWTKISGAPTAILPIKQLANTWSVKAATMSQATQMLVDCGLIRCVKPWKRVGGKPGEYVILDKSGYIPGVTKLYTRGHKAIVPRATVNNYNNNYIEKNNSFNKNNSSFNGRKKGESMLEYLDRKEAEGRNKADN